MFSSSAGVVDLISSIIVGKSNSDWLINTHEVTKEVPRPRIFDSLDISFGAFSVDRSNFVEASELAGSSGSSLEPDDEWYRLVFPGQGESLPKRIVDGSFSRNDVLISCIRLII